MIATNFSALPYKGSANSAYVILDNKVLDVTDYLDAATNIVKVAKGAHSRAFALDRMYLPLDLTILLYTNLGSDITTLYHTTIVDAELYKPCLAQLFFHGVVDIDRAKEGCARINVALWITMGCFLLYFLLKMNLANLTRLPFMQRFLFKSVPFNSSNRRLTTWTTTSGQGGPALSRYLPPYTLLFIPCYAEASDTMQKTFDSLARNNYPDTRKLLFFVVDGLAKSKFENKDSYLCLLESLGYSSTKDPELRSYISLGQGARRINYAKVYAGFYESGRNRVPFLMVVKVGSSCPTESLNSVSRSPGNRGKRDSMVIVLGFLERCMNLAHHRISPLEFELFNQCYNLLGIDPRLLKYMLVTDADTQVQDDVVMRLVTRLEADPNLLAISGHIRPANPEENVVTMLQIFPIYMTFYSGLAYEACLGSVTTINGGFVMYRLWKDTSSGFLLNDTYRMRQLDHHQYAKWPKVSDEIIIQDSKLQPSDIKREEKGVSAHFISEDEEDDDTSSDDNATTTNTTISTRNKTTNSSHRRRHQTSRKKKRSIAGGSTTNEPAALQNGSSRMIKHDSSNFFSQQQFALNKDITPICISPTVLRGFAAPRADTMHMENVLLLGEEQYLGLVLLRSHPYHRLGFEPEAIAYTTLPTNFFALQAQQVRTMRYTFHNLLEFQDVAKHLGFMYWIVSFTKLLDMIFSLPIIVYLYNIYIRYFVNHELAYLIIAGSFTGLIVLHIFYFMMRRQFKYVVWFIIYGLFSVPIFSIYFPLLAVWCMDDANRWYDVWPTKEKGYHSRLHGLVLDESPSTNQQQKEEQGEEVEEEYVVTRMRLADFEVLEAERAAQREKEQVELLDAKFNGFTGYVRSTNQGHSSKPSWSSSINSFGAPATTTLPPPALLQHHTSIKIKPQVQQHSRFSSEDDARYLMHSSQPTSIYSSPNNNNPNPFDDPPPTSRHKASHSQSSYLSTSTTNRVSSSFSVTPPIIPSPSAEETGAREEEEFKDTSSVLSLTNSVISLETAVPPMVMISSEPPRRRALYYHQYSEQGIEEQHGRKAPVHSRFIT